MTRSLVSSIIRPYKGILVSHIHLILLELNMAPITKLNHEDESLVQKIDDVAFRRYMRNELKRNLNELDWMTNMLIRSNNENYIGEPKSLLQSKIDYHNSIIKLIKEQVLKCNETTMETLTKLEINSEENNLLFDGLSLLLEGLDEDDERWEIYNSILNKLN